MGDKRYSVLMSVYYKELPQYLRESILSIYRQTIPTDDFVLVCDGPLSEALDVVIDEMKEKFLDRMQIIRLKKNGGLGNALNIGIKYCKNELVARMDSDDVSSDDRCEKELKIFEQNPNLSIVSGNVMEFEGSVENVTSCRALPEYQRDIIAFSKYRNPFNHPAIMYKKSAVINAGGYKDFYLLEDYYLWIRMLSKGFEGYNIQENILMMRSGDALYKRRGGMEYLISQYRLLEYMKEINFINRKEYLKGVFFRTCSVLCPIALRKKIYKIAFRRTL